MKQGNLKDCIIINWHRNSSSGKGILNGIRYGEFDETYTEMEQANKFSSLNKNEVLLHRDEIKGLTKKELVSFITEKLNTHPLEWENLSSVTLFCAETL